MSDTVYRDEPLPRGDVRVNHSKVCGPGSVVVVASRSAAEDHDVDEFGAMSHAAPEAIAALLQQRICASGGLTYASPTCGRLKFLSPVPTPGSARAPLVPRRGFG